MERNKTSRDLDAPIAFGPDGLLPRYEMDGEDGFVPDMIDEGRDSSSKSTKKSDQFNEEHLVKVYVLSPFLFGKIYQPDSWIKYLSEVGLLDTCKPISEDALTIKQLDIVEILETIHEVILTDSKENSYRKKQMRELFESIDKSVFDHDDSHLKVKPLTDLLDRSRKFSFLETWQKSVKEKKERDHIYKLDDRAMSVALIFCCRQFVEHWHRIKKGESLMKKFKEQVKKKDKQIEEVKVKGNKIFQEGSFERAAEFYTKAIRESPFNAILYGNRALSCLNYGHFIGALADGKRAIVLDPGWHKGYYRYAEAYFRLTHTVRALCVVELGLSHCPNDRNLLDQREKFKDPAKFNNNRLSAPNNEKQRVNSFNSRAAESDNSDSLKDHSDSDGDLPPLVSDTDDSDDYDDSDPPGLVTESDNSDISENEAMDTRHTISKREKKISHAHSTKKESSSKKSRKADKNVSQPWRRNAPRTDSERESESHEKNLTLSKMQNDRQTEIFRLLKQGSESLLDNRCLNAIHFYRKSLDVINKYRVENITIFMESEVVLLKYSLGISCVEMGTSKDINEGMRLFNEILTDHTTVKFPMAFNGLGRGWLKQFRFVECLETVERGLEVTVNLNQLTRHTWPGTEVTIKESLTSTLMENLQEMAIICRNPPVPDAVCRYHNCHGYYSIKIYVKDPEFKGFVRIHCFAKCIVEYHVECWRRYKKERLSQSDKDYLNVTCLTPDCPGRISKIHVCDQLGATLKETANVYPLITPDVGNTQITKPKAPREKMKLSSETRIAKKEAKKLSRKQRRKELQELEARRQEEEGKAAEGQGQNHAHTENPKDVHPGEEAESEAELLERLAAAHVYQKLEEAGEEGLGAQVGMEKYVTVLNRKEEEDEPQARKTMDAKSSNKTRSKKKQKTKVTMTLDEFVGPRETVDDSQPPVYMDCMDEFSPDSGLLDQENPFALPSRGAVRQELDLFEGLCAETSSVASSGSQSDNKHSQIKEALFSFFAGILSEYGPLDKDDVIIKRELEDFPAEAHEVIDSAGGIDKLLLQSLHFAAVDNFVCLLQDSMKAKKLADLHKNPLKRSESPIYAKISRPSSKMDFPSLSDSLAKVTIDTSSRGSRLDELDVFTTTAGNLDSPVTSPTAGIDTSAQRLRPPTNGQGIIQGGRLRRAGSPSLGNASVTLSNSNLNTIVHSVESSSPKPVKKEDSVEFLKKKTVSTEGDKISVKVDKDSILSATSKSDLKATNNMNGSGKMQSETASSGKKTQGAGTSAENESKPSSKGSNVETAKVVDKPVGTKPSVRKLAATFPVNGDAQNSNGISVKSTPEQQNAIKDSFKQQVQEAASKSSNSDKKKTASLTKVEKKSKTDIVKKTSIKEVEIKPHTGKDGVKKQEEKKMFVKETETKKVIPDKERNKPKAELKEKKTTGGNAETKEDKVKKDGRDLGKLQIKREEEIPDSDSYGLAQSGGNSSGGTSQSDNFVPERILRSCDDVSPVNSGPDPFTFPAALETGQGSHSSLPSLFDSTFDPTWHTKDSNKVTEVWGDSINVSLSDTKFQESGPWKSKLQEWKAPNDKGYGQLDKLSNDSEFITESRTSDKDPSPAKDVGVIGASSMPQDSKPAPKLSKPPGFGGKAFSTNSSLESSASGGKSKYGPIGSKSRTDSPASGSSKDSSKTSTPVHNMQTEIIDSQLPPFPSVHTGDSFLNGQSMVTTNLPMEAPYNNGLFVNSSVWSNTSAQQPQQSFSPSLPSHPYITSGFQNTDPIERSTQHAQKQNDERFIHETTDHVYKSLCDNEAFKHNPLLKQTIEADIRADVERAKTLSQPVVMTETSKNFKPLPLEAKPSIKPVVKTRNSATQCTPQDHVTSVSCNTDPYEPYKPELLKTQSELHVTNMRLHELMDKHTQLQNSTSAELKNLRSLVDALEQECKGLRRERIKAVEERDTENKKWTAEKRMVSEELKNMKKEIKAAKFREESALRQLQEKEGLIGSLSGQLNEERETIVSEREKFQSDREELHGLHSMQLSRAESAEVNLLQWKVEVGTQILDRSLKDAEMYAGQSHQIIQNLKDKNPTSPPHQLLATAEQWVNTVKLIKDIKQQSMAKFEEQIRQVRQGTPLSALPQLPIPRPPPPPENPMAVMNAFVRNNAGGMSGRPTGKVPPGAVPTNRPPNVRLPSTTAASQRMAASALAGQGVGPFTGPPPLNSGGNMPQRNPQSSQHKSKSAFDKIIDKLSTLFPNLARSDVTVYIQDFRSLRNGSLSGLSLDEIVRSVAEMILKDNARRATQQASLNATPSTIPGFQSAARMSPNPDRSPADEIFEEEDDPCIICHDELNAGSSVHLECCHRFHTECIKKWFKEQSTCPTCRIHALLPDDFPNLA